MDHRDILALTGEKDACDPKKVSRRRFFGLSAAAAAGLTLVPCLKGQEKVDEHKPAAQPQPAIATNIADFRKVPRTEDSMPGRFPGRVVRVDAPGACVEGKIDAARAKAAVGRGMTALTGEKDMGKAWGMFVSPKDVVGIKINPIGEKLLSTKPEVVDAIVEGLMAAGVPKSNIIIWDRRLFQMLEAGYTAERFPGIRILGTELRGPNGDFYDEKGELWSKDNIDRDAPPYFADVEMAYDKDMLPFMVNQGKESYFTRIVTREVTKIVNVPILKNAGATVTLCLKNLAYGSLSNTSRLHKIWMNSVVEPNAAPVLRDKVVLNVADGLQACYEGGPGANPKYIYEPNVMFFGTDPVAVDAVAHDFIVKERMARGVQQLDDRKRSAYLDLAAELGLGVCDRGKIQLQELSLT